MAHDWEAYYPPEKSNAQLFMGNPYRKCNKCNTVQERITHHAWMRVSSYQWLPLAGRCKDKSVEST